MVAYLALLYDSYLGSQNLTLLAFALGQLAYSVVVFSVYMANMPDTRLWPIRLPKVPSESPVQSRPAPYLWLAEFFDPNSFRLSASMTLQSIIKHFLTEGDKFLVSYWSPLEDQGGYAIAVNYGIIHLRDACCARLRSLPQVR
ncbi:hypothetical protein ID866_1500 [Astraeus odoratus]|nr:hypothetical protein ID866_1500 [Astraeus odoratus]